LVKRCGWTGDDALMITYHDEEWGGKPVKDDTLLFEFLLLESFQAGLSWKTILYKREYFRKAFDRFHVKNIANYDQAKKDALLQNPGIIRNRLKINAAVNNAQQFLRLQKEHDSFSNYIWQFTGGKTKYNSWKSMSEIPGSSPESDAMSKALQKEGFKFVGTTICYAFMQATGMVHDHLVDCHCYRTESELSE